MQEGQKNQFKILIVDDSDITHQLLYKLLDFHTKDNVLKTISHNNAQVEFPKFELTSAFQGEEAVKLVQIAKNENKPFALAFIDIRMPPGWDGLETITRIWRIDKYIQIVICTAYSDYSWEETVVGLAAFDNFLILKKPFDSMTARQLACSLTRKWQLTREAIQLTHHLEQQVRDRTDALLYGAMHDALTELPNRFWLTEQLKKMLQTHEQGKLVSIFLFDLDRFKLINDSMTHLMGDELLKGIAKRLQELTIDKKYLIARLGGDEFVIATNVFRNHEEVLEYAALVLKKISEPFQILNQELRTTACLGISIFSTDSDNAEILLRNADIAMYKAKEVGPNNLQLYSENIHIFSKESLELQNDLLRSLERNQLMLCYQPELNLATLRLKGLEALVRWKHPKKGLIQPLDFIPLAEETGFIVPLGEWVIRTACAQNKAWQDKGLPRMRVAVNVAASQFEQNNFVQLISDILKETQLNPQYLELELTENIIIGNGKIIDNIRALKAVGVQIALDDFGTGYSNLHHLKLLPIDRIKIDKGYTQNINENSNDEAIIRAVIAMGNSLNLQVLAEGIETPEQLAFLQAANCDEGQGFYFSKPLSADDLEKFLTTYQEAFQTKVSVKKK